jgi:glycosyltransferase involved in cell wall biosynthesis
LAKALESVDPSAEIHVVTTLPNRYTSFNHDALAFERRGRVTIERIALPTHKSGMIDQSKAFWSFAIQARRIVRDKQYDLVFATSSRLMTAALGAFIASRRRIPLYLDIRDIFVDTIKDVLPKGIARFAKPVFGLIERGTINRASKVNLVSGGFEAYFRTRFPHQHFSLFTNGIDEEFLDLRSDFVPERGGRVSGPLNVLYAGNIGEGQGLHAILPELGRRLDGHVNFKVIGDGGRREQLMQMLAAFGTTNVEISLPMPRDELIEEYRKADVLFLHLNAYDAFEKVLPSKIFEYAAMGKPVWAGLPGFSADFVRREVSNSAVFQPCDVDAAERALERLTIADSPRTAFVQKFRRTAICLDMAKDMIETAGGA